LIKIIVKNSAKKENQTTFVPKYPTMDKKKKSTLNINKGVEQAPSVNQDSINRFKKIKRKKYTLDEYIDGILNGDMVVLSKAITLAESNLQTDIELSQQIIEKCLPQTGKSMRIGITGVPGVGKSTFIESMGMQLTQKGHKLAVLAIDPSSGRSGGSILGDKTRMEELSSNPNAFIRPSASGGSLGGVANKTRETMLLCEAAGFDIIFIETVGVGQSEVAVHSMVDFFLLLMLAGAGDELQGIKRGIMEMADAVVINKADGNNKDKALRAKAEYNSALHLFPMPESNYAVKVQTCSAFHNLGLDEIWQNIEGYFKLTLKSGFLNYRRRQQAQNWMHQIIKSSLIDSFYNNETLMDNLSELEKKVLAGEKNPYYAANVLLNKFFGK